MARSHSQSVEHERKLAIVRSMLNSDDLMPCWKIANKLDVGLRSVHRYIACLRKTGLEIGGCKGHGGGLILLKPKRKVA